MAKVRKWLEVKILIGVPSLICTANNKNNCYNLSSAYHS